MEKYISKIKIITMEEIEEENDSDDIVLNINDENNNLQID